MVFWKITLRGGYLPSAALQCLGLIQNHVLPFDPLEVFDILDHQLVACDHHMERCILCVQCFLFKRIKMGG